MQPIIDKTGKGMPMNIDPIGTLSTQDSIFHVNKAMQDVVNGTVQAANTLLAGTMNQAVAEQVAANNTQILQSIVNINA